MSSDAGHDEQVRQAAYLLKKRGSGDPHTQIVVERKLRLLPAHVVAAGMTLPASGRRDDSFIPVIDVEDLPTEHLLIQKGDSGPKVRQIQQQLNAKGAKPPLAVDGIFGPLTRAAVVAFQGGYFADAADVTGQVGPSTWQALFESKPAPPPTTPPAPTPPPAAATRAPAAPADAAPSFTDPYVTRNYQAFAATLSKEQVAAFKVLDPPASGPWKHLDWSEVMHQAVDRIIKPTMMNQKTLGVCGQAAAVEGDAQQNPVGYATMVRHIFTKGEFEGTKINKTLLGNTVEPGMDAVDWMVMAALQDASNMVLDYDGRPKNWWQISEGTTAGGEEWLLKHLNKAVAVKDYSCALWGEDDATQKVSDLMSAYGEKVIVVMACDGGYLDDPQKPDGSANHWVTLLKPVPKGDPVEFSVFSWGKPMDLTWPRKNFRKFVYQYVVGALTADVKLD